MGIRQGVFDGDWKVKESRRDFHILPIVKDEFFHVDTPVSITPKAIVAFASRYIYPRYPGMTTLSTPFFLFFAAR